jgi:hypothetical protein
MANQKISAMTAAAALTGAELLEGVQDGDTVKLTASAISRVSIPSGGSTGQALAKASNASYDLSWQTISGGGGVGGGVGEADSSYPGTLADMQFWWESDRETASTGKAVTRLVDRTPRRGGPVSSVAGVGPLGSATLLNSLPVVNFNNSNAAQMNLPAILLDAATIFVVLNPTAFGAFQTIIGGIAGSLQATLDASGFISLFKSGASAIGSSSSALTAGSWAQFNLTYNSSTGAYAFRKNKAASGSGTNAQAITVPCTSFGYQPSAPQNINGLYAGVMIYNRVLSGTEITNVENYITTKWGV